MLKGALAIDYSYYHVYLPSDYDPEADLPAILDLHGASSPSSDPSGYMVAAYWQDLAEQEGYVIIQPQNRRKGWGLTTNETQLYAGTGPDSSYRYILAALADARARTGLALAEVYLTGFSSGANYVMALCVKEYARFAGCGTFASGIRAENTIFGYDFYELGVDESSVVEAAASGIPYAFEIGDEDVRLPTTQANFEYFEARGFLTRFWLTPGIGHSVPPDDVIVAIWTWLREIRP